MLPVTLASLVAALADVVGGWLTLRLAALRGELEYLTALGAGILLGSALFLLLPPALAVPGGPGLVALGFGAFLLLRALTHPGSSGEEGLGAGSAWGIFGGILLHSLIEGFAIALAVQVGGRAGLVALAAMSLHKVSEGFSLAAVVLSASRSPRLSLLSVVLVGMATVVGGWAALLGSQLSLLPGGAVLAVAAGSFLYVGAAELLPHVLHRGGSMWFVLTGMLLVYLLGGEHGSLSGHFH